MTEFLTTAPMSALTGTTRVVAAVIRRGDRSNACQTTTARARAGLVLFLGSGLAAGCKPDPDITTPSPPKVTVVVSVGHGVTGSPAAADSMAVDSGTVVQYRYTPVAGFTNVGVQLDGNSVPAGGSFVARSRHTLVVAADSVLALSRQDTVVVRAAKAMLTDPNPYVAYLAYQHQADSIRAALGIAAGTDRLRSIEAASFHPVNDAPALARLQRVVAESLQVQQTATLQRATSSAFAAGPYEVAFIYVNGIYTTLTSFGTTFSGTVVPLVQAAGFSNSSRFVIDSFYNPSILNVLATDRAAFLCYALKADRVLAGQVATVLVMPACVPGTATDLIQSVIQIANANLGQAPLNGQKDLAQFQQKIESYLAAGTRVVLLGHSQGNLYIQQALTRVGQGPMAARLGCIASVAVAPPTSIGWPVGTSSTEQIIAAGGFFQDILLHTPFPHGLAVRITTGKTDWWDRTWTLSTLPGAYQVFGVIGGIQIHFFENYAVLNDPLDKNGRLAIVSDLTNQEFQSTRNCPLPTQLQMASGDGQTATAGSAVPAPLVARVLDATGRGVPGANVTFTVTTGGGQVNGGTTAVRPTDATGSASVAWTLGPSGGSNQVLVSATLVSGAPLNGSPLTFRATATPRTGLISGTVSSPQRGVLAGVTVSTGALSTTTAANGTYTLSTVPVGAATVTLSTMPSGCTNPGSQTAFVIAGVPATEDFSVTCTPLPGSITGTIRSPELGLLANVRVTAGGLSATTSAGGGYTISGVPAGTVKVTVANLPATCIDPGFKNVTVPGGGPVTVNFSIDCPQFGTVTGTISSPQLGPLADVTVSAAGVAAITNGGGSYTLTHVPAGSVTVTLTTLPSGCTNPGSKPATVPANASTTVNFAVTCNTPTGSLIGTVTSPQLGALNGVTVTAAGIAVQTAGAGTYSILNVPTGSVTVTLSTLPSGCTNPGGQTTTVPSNGSTTVNFTLTCTVPTGSITGTVTSPQLGPLNGVTVAAGAITTTTNASGVYTLSSVPVGSATTSLSTLPSGCTNPGGQNATVTPNASTTLDFSVVCSTVSTTETRRYPNVCSSLSAACASIELETTNPASGGTWVTLRVRNEQGSYSGDRTTWSGIYGIVLWPARKAVGTPDYSTLSVSTLGLVDALGPNPAAGWGPGNVGPQYFGIWASQVSPSAFTKASLIVGCSGLTNDALAAFRTCTPTGQTGWVVFTARSTDLFTASDVGINFHIAHRSPVSGGGTDNCVVNPSSGSLGLVSYCIDPSRQGTVDQQQTGLDLTTTISLNDDTSGGPKVGLLVTPSRTGVLTRLDLAIDRCVGNGWLALAVRDLGPTGTLLTLAGSLWTRGISPPPGSFYQLDLGAVPVTAGRALWIEIGLPISNVPTSDYCAIFQAPVGDSYLGGHAYRQDTPANGSGWIPLSSINGRDDLPFRIYVAP